MGDDPNRSTDRFPAARRPRGDLSLDERLDRIEDMLEDLTKAQAKEASETHTIALRVRALEYVVYGACGMILVAVFGSLIYLVVKQQAHG